LHNNLIASLFVRVLKTLWDTLIADTKKLIFGKKDEDPIKLKDKAVKRVEQLLAELRSLFHADGEGLPESVIDEGIRSIEQNCNIAVL